MSQSHPDIDFIAEYIENKLQSERASLCLAAMRGDAIKQRIYGRSCQLLEEMRKEYKEWKDGQTNTDRK